MEHVTDHRRLVNLVVDHKPVGTSSVGSPGRDGLEEQIVSLHHEVTTMTNGCHCPKHADRRSLWHRGNGCTLCHLSTKLRFSNDRKNYH